MQAIVLIPSHLQPFEPFGLLKKAMGRELESKLSNVCGGGGSQD